MAAAEYKLLFNEIHKKCPITGSIFGELYIYNLFCCLENDGNVANQKKQLKELEAGLLGLLDHVLSNGKLPTLARFSFILVYTAEMKFIWDQKKYPKDLIYAIEKKIPEYFKASSEHLESRFIYASLEELRGRLLLYENPPQFRNFSYRTVKAAHRYGELKLDDYGLAAGLIANQYHRNFTDSNWTSIVEWMSVHLLGKLSYSAQRWPTAMKSFINGIQQGKTDKGDEKDGMITISRVIKTIEIVKEAKKKAEESLSNDDDPLMVKVGASALTLQECNLALNEVKREISNN
jgi:hypothetical protein